MISERCIERERERFHGKIDLERKRSISEDQVMLTEQMFKGLNSFRLL